ncbi:glycosyltransferase [Hyphomicrobiales bacterium]|jgi:glycosyltransferase involved in cell wall biosynthesis|uniref:glycosyltransferase n=1 Tax=unclassified Rhizobium TaxID=2613769 RepID=UPI000DDD2933
MTAGISSKLPSLAIIIPCYNNVETLAEALDSALAQDYPNFEVHICDNGSTDGSREMIASYSSPLLKPALHRDTVPRTDNWNRAYTAGANADYLVTLHADDRLAPGALRAIGRAAMRHPALIHGRFRQITYEGDPIPGRRFGWSYSNSGEAFRELLLLNNMVAMPGATIRTDVFFKAGRWDPAWQYLQDMELWWRCGELGEVAFVADMLGDHRAYKHPQALHRHAEEHLRWATRRLRNAPTRRLRQAAADGLNAYLTRLEAEVDALPDVAGSLVEPVRAARAALAKAPGTRVDALRRQRLLRMRAASLSAIAKFFGRLSPWQALSR